MTRAVDKPCFALQLRAHKGEKYGANYVCVLCVTLTVSAEEQHRLTDTTTNLFSHCPWPYVGMTDYPRVKGYQSVGMRQMEELAEL